MSSEAPKRWDRKRRRERDSKLAWKAFWFFLVLVVLVALEQWLELEVLR